MGVRDLPHWRPVPFLDALRRSTTGTAARPRIAAAIRRTTALLLRYEGFYALPAIMLLVLNFDSKLALAWNVPGGEMAWWRGIELDRTRWLLPVAVGLPL